MFAFDCGGPRTVGPQHSAYRFTCTTHSHVPSCGHGRDQAELDVVVDQELNDCWWPLIRSLLTSSISTYDKPHVWISVRSFVLKKHRSLHSWPTAMSLFTSRTISFYQNICWELPFGGNTQLLQTIYQDCIFYKLLHQMKVPNQSHWIPNPISHLPIMLFDELTNVYRLVACVCSAWNCCGSLDSCSL